jgi:hypothetical protein
MLWATCPLPTALFTIIAAMVLDFAISHSKGAAARWSVALTEHT